jgi:hypothetical protein
LFKRKNGWLIIWWVLIAPNSFHVRTPGSVEGMIHLLHPPAGSSRRPAGNPVTVLPVFRAFILLGEAPGETLAELGIGRSVRAGGANVLDGIPGGIRNNFRSHENPSLDHYPFG